MEIDLSLNLGRLLFNEPIFLANILMNLLIPTIISMFYLFYLILRTVRENCKFTGGDPLLLICMGFVEVCENGKQELFHKIVSKTYFFEIFFAIWCFQFDNLFLDLKKYSSTNGFYFIVIFVFIFFPLIAIILGIILKKPKRTKIENQRNFFYFIFFYESYEWDILYIKTYMEGYKNIPSVFIDVLYIYFLSSLFLIGDCKIIGIIILVFNILFICGIVFFPFFQPHSVSIGVIIIELGQIISLFIKFLAPNETVIKIIIYSTILLGNIFLFIPIFTPLANKFIKKREKEDIEELELSILSFVS